MGAVRHADNPSCRERLRSDPMGTIAVSLIAIVLSSPLGGLALFVVAEGDPLAFFQERVAAWNYFDGWPFVAWFCLIGPTVAGPIAVRCTTGSYLSWPIVSGANLWQLLGLVLLPTFIAALFTWASLGQLAFGALFLVEILIRAGVFPLLTGAVLLRYAFVLKRVSATKSWEPTLPSGLDCIGVGIGILWTLLSIGEFHAYFTYGLRK